MQRLGNLALGHIRKLHVIAPLCASDLYRVISRHGRGPGVICYMSAGTDELHWLRVSND